MTFGNGLLDLAILLVCCGAAFVAGFALGWLERGKDREC